MQLTTRLIKVLKAFFCSGNVEGSSGQMAGSALWLVCRCLQGTQNKREALVQLGESGLIEDFLREGQLDPQAEKAIAMLLYFIAKNHENRTHLIAVILQNEHRFEQPEAIKHLLATLREATTASF
jgi:hypothetical protein